MTSSPREKNRTQMVRPVGRALPKPDGNRAERRAAEREQRKQRGGDGDT